MSLHYFTTEERDALVEETTALAVTPDRDAVRRTVDGISRSFGANSRARRDEPVERPAPKSLFSPAQRRVLDRLTSTGGCNKQIAHEIGCVEITVKIHLMAMCRAVGVTNRVQLALWAVRNGEAA